MSEVAVEIKNLSYKNNDDKYILKNINLKIKKGEYIAIVGGNGTGKSTLLKLMINLIKPTNGSVNIYEKEIGYLSQQVRNFNTEFPATVNEVVMANLYSKMGIFKIQTSKHKEKVLEALKTVGMEDSKDKLIGRLSGGQQQRVFLARLLVNEPKIIFMDEPTVGLDNKFIEKFYEIMDKLNKEIKITIVMVSHDRDKVKKRADKIFCVENGRVEVI